MEAGADPHLEHGLRPVLGRQDPDAGQSPRLFAGSPIYVLYLRLLGAKIGKGVMIFSRTVPVCTDLLTIGDNTVIHKNSFFLCYRARPGVLEKGPVTFGRNVLVSEKTTFDIGTVDGG